MIATFRHAGILVKNLEEAQKTYRTLGFKQVAAIETLRVLKMADKYNNIIELVQGNWHPHIAVNWYEGPDGNYIEVNG